MNKYLFIVGGSLWILHLYLFSARVQAAPAEIIIEAAPAERREVNRPGQTTVIRPTEETRFDTDSHLKSDPSLSLSNSGRAGGFSLPLFRGQDARASHVFINDLELQDPFSGLPMIDDIDLRAFGVMTIHKGFAPWNLPIIDPGGVIQFTMRRPISHLEGGTSYGDVQGSNSWLKAAKIGDDVSENLDGGLYLRHRAAKGNYKYYSDNNTVLNSSDDVIKRRKNNDRSSQQALGHLSWTGSRVDAQGIVWSQESDQGLPVNHAFGDGGARIKASTGVTTSSLVYHVTEDQGIAVDVGHFSGKRIFSDPALDIGMATKRKLASESTRGRISFTSTGPSLKLLVLAERQEAKTKLTSSYDQDLYAPSATREKIYAGANYKLTETQTIEIKSSVERSEATAQTALGEKHLDSVVKPTVGSSIGWSFAMDDLYFYAQAGRSTRVPSLLERLGNGAEIDGSSNLKNEQSRAVEVGSRLQAKWFDALPVTYSVALWARDNESVIQITKVSATRWRAQNGGAHSYRGVETRMDIGSSDLGVEGAVSWIKAELGRTHLLVPRVPLWQATSGVRWRMFEVATLRTISRFVGRMYDDTSNTRELGWTLVHDLSADYSANNSRWKLGVACLNVTNVMSNIVRDRVTSQGDGKKSYSGYNEEPMPGRSWLASISAKL
jgi:hypothetical protein